MSHTIAARRRRRLLIALAAAVLLAVVLLVFEPQTLFIDTRVDDAFPGAVADTPAPEASTTAASEAAVPVDRPTTSATPEVVVADPVVLASGDFVSRDHDTTGVATVYELAADGRVLRFEDLVTDNGPDLKVYLSTAPPDAPSGDFDAEFVDLGVLAGNLGNQNYDVPADVDLSRFRSVVIWCDRFDVPFGAAPLGS